MTRSVVLTSITIFLTVSLPSCSTLRKIASMVPEIPEIFLIGGEKAPPDPVDPATLEPDLKNDVAIFKLDVQGRRHRLIIGLFPEAAPMTVANFQQLIRRGHYEGMAIHRVIPNYLVQMGDPQSKDPEARAAWGTGGLETTTPREIHLPHRLGAVAMARLEDAVNPSRQSSGSQFYIALGELSRFDRQYTVFGQVIQGYDILQTISEFPADENDNPYQRIEIKSTYLDRSKLYTPEDIDALRRTTRRRTLEEMPTRRPGLLQRAWDLIW